MTSRQEIFAKYYTSNIFNTNPVMTEAKAVVRVREPQSPLARTKNDIFNTEKKQEKATATKQGIKRQGVYSKIYGSDIFCQTKPSEKKKGEGVKKFRNANCSSFMESMKDNEGFKNNIKKYTAEHRAPKKEYNPDKYLKVETAAERYYKEIYDPHGSTVLPERCLSSEHQDKKKYSEKRKNFKKEMAEYNDCGADGKKKPGEHEGLNAEKKIFVKKKGEWNDNNNECHFVDSKSQNNCKINKQLNLQSNIFKENDKNDQNGENNQNLNVEKIKARIEEEKAKNEKDQKYHLGNENEKRDITNNDRNLWGSVHTKWETSNLDWKNPQTELMFGSGVSQDAEKNFGPDGPNAFQRKLNQLADTKNKDTISEENKIPINNLQKPISEKVVNGEGMEKVEEILEEIPNLKEDKKFKLKMSATTSLLHSDDLWDKKAKTLNKFYSKPNVNNAIKNKRKEVAIKVGKTNNEKQTKSGHDYCDYVLAYPTKKGHFEKYSEGEIKKIFGSKGVHVYDVKKNMFDKGNYNTIKFKVRENENEADLKKKLNEVQKEFEKNDFKIEINKEKKQVNKNSKNFIRNPGSKIHMINENAENNGGAKFTKIPDNIKYKKNFSNLFADINHDYKNNKENK